MVIIQISRHLFVLSPGLLESEPLKPMIKWAHGKSKEPKRNEEASENTPLLYKFSRNQEIWTLDTHLFLLAVWPG